MLPACRHAVFSLFARCFSESHILARCGLSARLRFGGEIQPRLSKELSGRLMFFLQVSFNEHQANKHGSQFVHLFFVFTQIPHIPEDDKRVHIFQTGSDKKNLVSDLKS